MNSFVSMDQPTVPEPTVAALRLQSLVGAMAMCQRSSRLSNVSQRQAAYNGFVSWLNQMGAITASASPAHVITYPHDYSKTGTFITPSGPRCAPGSIKNLIGFLRKGMAVYAGRSGPYNLQTQQGTSDRWGPYCVKDTSVTVCFLPFFHFPFLFIYLFIYFWFLGLFCFVLFFLFFSSQSVSCIHREILPVHARGGLSCWVWLIPYEKTMAERGYRPTSARSWSEEVYLKIQKFLSNEVTHLQGISHVHAARDALAISLEWQLSSRGLTAIGWCLHQLKSSPGDAQHPCPIILVVCLSLSCSA